MEISKHCTYPIVEICEDDIHVNDFIHSIVNAAAIDDRKDAFFVCDVGDVVKKLRNFKKLLPQVQPFYAMKSNPDPVVLKVLADLGANFDCASEKEIKTILELGVSPERIVFANPCKIIPHVKYAKENNINMMTFDNKMELHKIKEHHPNAELIVRIKVDDSRSVFELNSKFGVRPAESIHLLKLAWELELNVIGVSFHVGSGCYDTSLYYKAIKSARMVFDEGKSIGYHLHLLDIGGGFPGTDMETLSFEEIAEKLTSVFAEFFPPGNDVTIIAEPGRHFVASAFTSICNISSVREVVSDNGYNTTDGVMYYLNDGVYGSFTSENYAGPSIPYPLKQPVDTTIHKSTLWGPTCASKDRICSSVMLPKMNVGDWICFDNRGAYCISLSSEFNGFLIPKVKYMCNRTLMDYIATENSSYCSHILQNGTTRS